MTPEVFQIDCKARHVHFEGPAGVVGVVEGVDSSSEYYRAGQPELAHQTHWEHRHGPSLSATKLLVWQTPMTSDKVGIKIG